MTARCWCGRPVARDVPDAYLCAEHDDAPPNPRPGIWHPGFAAAVVLALAVMVGSLGVLLVQFDARFDVQPSPAGPTVVEVAR